MLSGTETARFWERVEKSDGCWLWRNTIDGDGYGRFHPLGSKGRYLRAHHVAYALANDAAVPRGMVVMHTCDVPACVRPEHLRIGTQADNIADRHAKGRTHRGPQRNPNPRRGELNGNAKLTDRQRVVIVGLYADGRTQQSIADRFGITQVTVSRLVRMAGVAMRSRKDY